MTTSIFLAVLAAAVLHASWNALAKSAGWPDALSASAAIAIGGAFVSGCALPFVGLPDPAIWSYVLLSAIVHVGYFMLIGLAYERTDFSVVYPLNRGTAPLGTTLIGAALIGENLSIVGWSGVGLLSCGILGLGIESFRRRALDTESILLAFVTSGVIVAYTVIDGLAARLSGDAGAYVLAMMLATGILQIPVVLALRGPGFVTGLRQRAPFVVLGGAMVTASYGIVVWAMTEAPIALVAALRETSVLFATIIAAFVLKERLGPARWIAAAAIVAGAMLLRHA